MSVTLNTKTQEVPGTWANDSHTTIKIPTGSTWRVPNEVVSYIYSLELKEDKAHKLIEELAQVTADTSAMMTPFSGFSMIAYAMLARNAGEFIGKEIKPREEVFEGTIKIVSSIRRPLDKILTENQEKIKTLEDNLKRTEALLEEAALRNMFYRVKARDVRDVVEAKVAEFKNYNQDYFKLAITRFASKYDYYDSIYLIRDGVAFIASTFKTSEINFTEWDDRKFAYGDTPEDALDKLATKLGLSQAGGN